MEKLDYGTLLSPLPVRLSIGSIRKPTLKEISEISFQQFNFFEVLSTLTPGIYYGKLAVEDERAKWEDKTQEEQDAETIYNIIMRDKTLADSYLLMLNFFFKETVLFEEGYYFILKDGLEKIPERLTAEDIEGVVGPKNFDDVMYVIRQTCCLDIKKEKEEPQKFKNALAKKLYEKMQKSAKSNEVKDKNHTLPNIISAVSCMHPALTPVSVWDLTVFQLLDAFNRLEVNGMYQIESNRVSVWGDEKKTFNQGLWYKNFFEK